MVERVMRWGRVVTPNPLLAGGGSHRGLIGGRDLSGISWNSPAWVQNSLWVFGSIVVSISACQLTLSAEDRGSIPRQRAYFLISFSFFKSLPPSHCCLRLTIATKTTTPHISWKSNLENRKRLEYLNHQSVVSNEFNYRCKALGTDR